MNTKTISIVSTEFPPGPGGIGNHAYSLSNHLAKKGYKVFVISEIRKEYETQKIKLEKNVFVEYIDRGSNIFQRYFNRWKTSKKYIKRSDLVISSGIWADIIVAFLPKKIKKKVIIIGHGIDVNPKQKIKKWLITKAFHNANQIVAVSSYTKKIIPEKFHQKTVVINNGFTPIVLDNSNNDVYNTENVNLLTVGNVTQRKGQENVIRALPTVVKKIPNIHYHMVGIPTEKDRLKTIASELNVLDYVTFHGVVSDKKLGQYLKEADIFIMLSDKTSTGDFEGFGIAILEANYLGTPSIGAEDCGIEDAVDHGFSGLLVNPHNPKEIAIAVQQILDSDFSQNAHIHAESFLWARIIEKYISIL